MGCVPSKKRAPIAIAMNDQKPPARKPTIAEKLATDRRATNARYYMDTKGRGHTSLTGRSISGKKRRISKSNASQLEGISM